MTPEDYVKLMLLGGAAAAYDSPVLDPPDTPCSKCGTPVPAREPAECDVTDCPLEGAHNG